MRYPNDLNINQKHTVLKVFRFLMMCNFSQTVTNERLNDRLTSHINEWKILNGDTIVDKDKFIKEASTKLRS